MYMNMYINIYMKYMYIYIYAVVAVRGVRMRMGACVYIFVCISMQLYTADTQTTPTATPMKMPTFASESLSDLVLAGTASSLAPIGMGMDDGLGGCALWHASTGAKAPHSSCLTLLPA